MSHTTVLFVEENSISEPDVQALEEAGALVVLLKPGHPAPLKQIIQTDDNNQAKN